MNNIPSKSIDMILCDLPYSITQNHWDSLILLNNYILLSGKIVEYQKYSLKQALKGLGKKI